MSNTRDTGFLRNAIQVTDQGVTFVSGSTTLMSISSSGAVTTTGVISGSNALSASFSLNSALLNGIGSVGFATTGALLEVSSSQQQISSSLLQVSASYISLSGSYTTFSGSASTRITVDSASLLAVSSSQQQISASLLNVVANYATTGSNSFRANQSITGSLVVSSTITAQTLVVQTVTSSILYSSGSNIFGNQLVNTQTFTGSVNITGSMSVTGSASFYNTKADYGLSITNVQDSSQGLLIRSSDNDTGLYVLNLQSSVGATSQTWVSRLVVDKAGSVGIGTTNPRDTFVVSGNGGAVLERFAETDPYSGDLYFYSAKGTAASPTTKANGDTAMGIRPRAYDGTSYLDVASIVSKIDGVVSTNVMPGNLIFSTNGGGTTLAERMRIASNGKISISAPTTADAFTVQGASNYWTSILTSGTTTSQAYGLLIKAGTNASDVSFLIQNTSGTDILRILGTGTSTFASSVTTSTSVTAGTFLGVTKAGANGVGEGPYVVVSQPTSAIQYLMQLNASAGLDYWHYNGSAWSVPLKISTTGAVTLPSQPSFLAASNASEQTYTAGQVIVFNLTRHNTGSHYNTSTGRFTAPVAGKYFFSVNFYTYASFGVSITLTINGSQYVPGDVVPLIYKPADTVSVNLGFSIILDLSASDYVEIRVRSGSYTSKVYMSHSHFTGQLLS